MNIQQAKDKLRQVKQSTGTKHHKILINELCTIVEFLLNEIDKPQSRSCNCVNIPKKLPVELKESLPPSDPLPPLECPPPQRNFDID